MGNTTDLSVRFKDYWDAVLPSAQKRLTQSLESFSKKSVKTAVYWI